MKRDNLSYETKSKETYNYKAINYDDTFDGKFTRPFKKILLNKVQIKDNDTLLDVACGNGTLLSEFKNKYNSYSLKGIGIDLSDEMIAIAKNKYSNLEFYNSSCENLIVKDNSIDVITVSASFHHFPDVEKFIKEVNRVLKDNGTIYIAEIYLPVINHIINPFLKYSKAGDVKIYSINEIIKLFEQQNFSVKSVNKHGYIQLLAFNKKAINL